MASAEVKSVYLMVYLLKNGYSHPEASAITDASCISKNQIDEFYRVSEAAKIYKIDMHKVIEDVRAWQKESGNEWCL